MSASFGSFSKEALVEGISSIQQSGRIISLRSSHSCFLCRRKIGPMGRLLWAGAPTCNEPKCEMIKATELTELFVSPYGKTLDSWTIRVFCRSANGPYLAIERASVLERAMDLAEAHEELLEWQWVYDSWMMTNHPEAYEKGKTILIPPRRIEDIRRIRLNGPWEKADPTSFFPEELRIELHKIRSNGPVATKIPF